MMWRNTDTGYGLVSILLHWLVAIAVFCLFGSGLWMVELDYYHPWYHRAPELHKSFGITLLFVLLARLAWRLGNPHPRLAGSPRERGAALRVHRLLYGMMYLLLISGYLISTADGRAIEVFGRFALPATLSGLDGQAELAGMAHEWLSYLLVGTAALHAAAALKHHFVNRDDTLRRMLWFRQ